MSVSPLAVEDAARAEGAVRLLRNRPHERLVPQALAGRRFPHAVEQLGVALDAVPLGRRRSDARFVHRQPARPECMRRDYERAGGTYGPAVGGAISFGCDGGL